MSNTNLMTHLKQWSKRKDLPTGAGYTYVRAYKRIKELEAEFNQERADYHDMVTLFKREQTKVNELEAQLDMVRHMAKTEGAYLTGEGILKIDERKWAWYLIEGQEDK